MIFSNSRSSVLIFGIFFIVLWAEYFDIVEGKPNAIVESFENTLKSPNDRRSYRGLKLSNEMNVLLISDPSPDVSAAYMVVGVGAINDFPDVPGLANFVGYMVLHGSREYPNIEALSEFLEQRGGRLHLPVTRIDHQLFGFEVNTSYLDEVLHIFAQLFADPLLPDTPQPAAVMSSVRFVQEEYKRSQNVDELIIAEVEKLTCKRNSMYNHFFIGNAKTLCQHVPDDSILKLTSLGRKVSRFHEIWYSSNIMNLVVSGKESLDQLEAMVVPRFAQVRNKEKQRFKFPDGYYPWGPEEMRNMIYIVPKTNLRSLRMNFSFPVCYGRYKAAPQMYITYFFAQNDEGSLVSALHRRGHCDSLSLEFLDAAGITFCVIKCNITDYGLEYGVDEIIDLVFQYIHLLKIKGVDEKFYREIQKERKLHFLNYTPSEPTKSYLQSLATLMQAFPLKDVLFYQYFNDPHWDPLPIQQMLGHLRPDNMNVTIVSPSLGNIAKQEERYFGTKYAIRKIDDESIKDWTNIEDVTPELKLPQCNEFLPDNINVHTRSQKEPTYPYIIHQSPKLEIWFKQDDVLKTPKLRVIFMLYSSTALNDPFGYILWHIYDTVLAVHLQKQLRSASIAGFNWKISFNDEGIRVILTGYSQKLPLLLEKLLSKMINVADDVDEMSFRISKAASIRYLNPGIMKDHLRYAAWQMQLLKRDESWPLDTIIHAATMLQRKDFRKFLSKSFRRIFIRGLVYGNCTRKNAKMIANIIEEKFRYSQGLLLQEMILGRRSVERIDGSNSIQQSFHETRNIFGYAYSFQLHTRPSTSNNATGFLLLEIILDMCRKILPTHQDKEDAAEKVICSVENKEGVRELMIMIRSEKLPRFVEKKVEQFLRSALEHVISLPDQGFKKFQRTVQIKRYTEPTSLAELTQKYWSEIIDRQYNFDRIEKECRKLFALKKGDIVKFFNEVLEASRRRKLVVQVIPEDIKQTKPSYVKIYIPGKATKIEDHFSFKTSSTLLPLNYNLKPVLTYTNSD